MPQKEAKGSSSNHQFSFAMLVTIVSGSLACSWIPIEKNQTHPSLSAGKFQTRKKNGTKNTPMVSGVWQQTTFATHVEVSWSPGEKKTHLQIWLKSTRCKSAIWGVKSREVNRPQNACGNTKTRTIFGNLSNGAGFCSINFMYPLITKAGGSKPISLRLKLSFFR